MNFNKYELLLIMQEVESGIAEYERNVANGVCPQFYKERADDLRLVQGKLNRLRKETN